MERYIYVGTYTKNLLFGEGNVLHGKGKGIYRLIQDTNTGLMSLDEVWEGIENPSYLTLNRRGDRLYAVNELQSYAGEPGGSISAFAVEGKGLRLLSRLGTGGMDPCHVALLEDKQSLYVANYSSGSVSVFSLDGEGSLSCRRQLIQHEGSSVDPQRQEGPHAHSVVLQGEHAYVCDLGLDSVLCYQVDSEGLLEERRDLRYRTAPGAGPRHCVFHPDGKRCYVVNELDSTVSIARYEDGRVYPGPRSYSTLPGEGLAVPSFCAAIRITGNGNFLYASNRGHDSIAVFQTEGDGLKLVQCCDCRGEFPRDFTLTPDGRFLICANQKSDTLTVFALNAGDGTMDFVQEVLVPTPVCVVAL